MVRWDLRGEPPFTAETLSHPSVHVLFERHRADVSGVPTRRFTRVLEGEGRVFGIKFRPAAFQPVLGAPLSRLTDRVVDMAEVFGPRSDVIRTAIPNEDDVQKCVTLAEAFLREVLPAMPAPIARIRDLVEQLAVDPAITRAEQAAVLMGMELRTLQRRFKAAVGVGPKWVIQRYRLHEAAAQLARQDPPQMAELAAQLGYFDQSHFIRDFKAVVGKSPGEYAEQASR